MALQEKIAGVIEDSIDALIKVKDSFWPIKKGEGFERATTPKTKEEAYSLSILGPNTAIILPAVDALEEEINFFCNIDDHSLNHMTSNIARAFGSIKGGKRMELSFNTIKDSKEVPNFALQGSVRAPPEYFGDNPPNQDDGQFRR